MAPVCLSSPRCSECLSRCYDRDCHLVKTQFFVRPASGLNSVSIVSLPFLGCNGVRRRAGHDLSFIGDKPFDVIQGIDDIRYTSPFGIHADTILLTQSCRPDQCSTMKFNPAILWSIPCGTKSSDDIVAATSQCLCLSTLLRIKRFDASTEIIQRSGCLNTGATIVRRLLGLRTTASCLSNQSMSS